MLGFILFLIIIGLIGGFVALAVVPGRDALSRGATLLLGIVGSFVGGFLGYVLFRNDDNSGAFQASGIIVRSSVRSSPCLCMAPRPAAVRWEVDPRSVVGSAASPR